MNQGKTELSSLGEFGLIHHLTKNTTYKNPSTIKGVGDDAAVLDLTNGQTVVTTDLLVEGIHFDLTYVPLKHLGYKAVAVNLSDVYAMNARPKQITVSIAVSKKIKLEHLEDLYAGIQKACEVYHVDLVGGDTTSSLTGLLISITAIGEAKKEDIVYRNGAKVTDLILVSGDLGAAYAGLQVLEREKMIYNSNPNAKLELENYDYILERQLKPEPRRDIVEFLKSKNVKPTAMIDISDGLSSEILHICTQSGVGCKIYEEKLPIDPQTTAMANELHLDSTTFALNGGEDYELLFTIPIQDLHLINKDLKQANLSLIGHITEAKEGTFLVARNGAEVPLMAQGWNAMKKD